MGKLNIRRRHVSLVVIAVLLAVVALLWRPSPQVSTSVSRSDEGVPAPTPSVNSPQPPREAPVPAAARTSSPTPDLTRPAPAPTVTKPETILSVEESALGPVWIAGTVRGEDGAPIRSATVSLVRQNTDSPALGGFTGATRFSREVPLGDATTDGQGYYQLLLVSDPPFVVSARAKEHVTAGSVLYGSDLRPITTTDGLRVVHRDLTLRRGTTFSGRVVDESGTPVGEVGVTLLSRATVGRGWEMIGAVELSTSSNGEGEFEFQHVPSGQGAVLRLGKVGYVAAEYFVEAVAPARDWIIQREGGRIEGRVLDVNGDPLARIPVVVYANKPANIANLDPVRLSAESDADGRFYFSPLAAGSWSVVAQYREVGTFGIRGSAGMEVALGELETREGIELRLPGLMTIRGVVISAEENTAITGAELSSRFSDLPGEDVVVSDGEGRFELTNLYMTRETWMKLRGEFFVRRSGYLEGGFAGEPQEIEDGILGEKVILKRADTVTLSGVVVDRKGQRVPDVVVIGDGLPKAKAITDGAGRFTLPVLQDCMLNLSAIPSKGPKTFHPAIQVRREAIKNIGIVLDPGATLELIVLDPDGAPVPQATVWAMRRTYGRGSGSASHFRREIPGEDGRLLIEDLPSSGATLDPRIDRVSMDAGAEHEDYDPVEVTDIQLKPGETNRQELRLLAKDTSGALEGFVRTENGSPIEGAIIQVQGKAMKTTTTDALGFFHLEDIRPDTYFTRIDHPDYETWSGRLAIPAHDVSLTLQPKGK